jgi:hypothetical protein
MYMKAICSLFFKIIGCTYVSTLWKFETQFEASTVINTQFMTSLKFDTGGTNFFKTRDP